MGFLQDAHLSSQITNIWLLSRRFLFEEHSGAGRLKKAELDTHGIAHLFLRGWKGGTSGSEPGSEPLKK